MSNTLFSENRSVFSRNIKAGRRLKGWTQEEAAAQARIKRSLWGAYEEGRAFPPAETLSSIAEALHVEDDLYGFINNPEFYDGKGRRRNTRKQSTIEQKYHGLKPAIRMAVDALMNISQNV